MRRPGGLVQSAARGTPRAAEHFFVPPGCSCDDPGGPLSARPHRPTRLSPDAIAALSGPDVGMSEAELLARLEQALASLPDAERAAVVTALGYAEGVEAVAQEQGLSPGQAEALTRSALQLLRGALADCDLRTREVFAHGQRRAMRRPRAE